MPLVYIYIYIYYKARLFPHAPHLATKREEPFGCRERARRGSNRWRGPRATKLPFQNVWRGLGRRSPTAARASLAGRRSCRPRSEPHERSGGRRRRSASIRRVERRRRGSDRRIPTRVARAGHLEFVERARRTPGIRSCRRGAPCVARAGLSSLYLYIL